MAELTAGEFVIKRIALRWDELVSEFLDAEKLWNSDELSEAEYTATIAALANFLPDARRALEERP